MIRIRLGTKPKKRFYVCNRERCPNCKEMKHNECRYTTDIDYALYDNHPEELFDIGRDGTLWELIR